MRSPAMLSVQNIIIVIVDDVDDVDDVGDGDMQ